MGGKQILIAGATGYVGSQLAEELRSNGEAVRAMVRDPSSDPSRELERLGCEIVKADALEPESLQPALEGCSVAYYLIHSMGRGGDGDYAERDKRAAENFGGAAKAAGVELIVYLGGLTEGGSDHLKSRHQTKLALERSGPPITYVRAAVVVGAGSESFRTILYLVRRLPVMLTPRWTKTRTQPIAITDVRRFLAAIPGNPEARGREIQIGGPDVTTYGGMMDAMAEAMGRRPRPRVNVPILSPALSSHWIGLVTPVDADVARPLVEGLNVETVITDASGMELFEIERTPFDRAMSDAVAASDEAD